MPETDKSRNSDEPVPLYFRGGSGLFGMFHPPAGRGSRQRAVVICGPIGDEAFAAHRVLRVLASRLARSGYPALRFDYFGCGDSRGDDADVTLDRCIDSLYQAVDEARSLSGKAEISAIGLGLGATIVALAWNRRPETLHAALLWNPVVRGSTYLQTLAADSAAQFGHRPHTDSAFDSIGFRLSDDFVRDLKSLTATRLAANASSSPLVVDSEGDLSGPWTSVIDPGERWSCRNTRGRLTPAKSVNHIVKAVEATW